MDDFGDVAFVEELQRFVDAVNSESILGAGGVRADFIESIADERLLAHAARRQPAKTRG